MWFTEKARDGRPRCFRFRVWPRKRENLERGYRHGRYGAVPDISPGELVRLMRLGQSDSEAAQSPGLGPTGSALD